MTKTAHKKWQRNTLRTLWFEGYATEAEAAQVVGTTPQAVRHAWRALRARYGVRPVPGQLELW